MFGFGGYFYTCDGLMLLPTFPNSRFPAVGEWICSILVYKYFSKGCLVRYRSDSSIPLQSRADRVMKIGTMMCGPIDPLLYVLVRRRKYEIWSWSVVHSVVIALLSVFAVLSFMLFSSVRGSKDSIFSIFPMRICT